MSSTERLEDLTTKIGSGATPRGGSTVYRDTGIAFIRSQNVLDNKLDTTDVAWIDDAAAAQLSGVTVLPNDVLLNITGDSIARCCVVAEDALPARVSQHVAIIRPNPSRLNAQYLQRFLVNGPTKEHLLSISGGGTRNALTKVMIEAIELSVPPLDEQRAVAEVLGALDEKIAANVKVMTTAAAFVRAHYDSAVTVEADSKMLLEVVDIEFGEAFKGASFTTPGEGRPLIRIRDLKTFSSQVWTSETRVNEAVVKAGDVLVGMDAEFRATAWEGTDGLLNQRVCRARGRTFGPAMTTEILRRPLARIEAEKSATTVIHLNKTDLARSVVLVPDTERLAVFAAIAEPVYNHRIALALENRALVDTRDALIPLLMSGKVRVKDAEHAVSEVT